MRDTARERRTVLDYLHSLPPGDFARLEASNARLRSMHPMCSLAVLVPSRNEAPCLPWFLELMHSQHLDRRRFEVILLVNRRSGEDNDGSTDITRAWMRRRSDGLVVHLIEHVHGTDEKAPLTTARKILADLALYRSVRRTSAARPLYLSCQDVDLLWVDPRESDLIIETLDANPGLDGVRGQQDRCPWVMMNYALLFLMRRSWNFCETYAARRDLRPDLNPDYDFNWNRLVTSGWSSAFTAEAYAEIRGYTPHRLFEEDMDIGEKISCLRGYEEGGRFVAQTHTIGRVPIRSEGSCRRWIYSLRTRLSPYDEANDYDNFFNRRHEAAVKGQSLDALEKHLREPSPRDEAEILTGLLQADLDFMLRAGGAEGEAAFRRVLSWLGFRNGEAHVHARSVVVTELRSVRQRIRDYVERHRDLRPGYPPSEPRRSHRSNWRRSQSLSLATNDPATVRSMAWSAGRVMDDVPAVIDARRLSEAPLVVFDLDGTLVDTTSYAIEAHRRAFLELGLPPPPESRLREALGRPVETFYERLLPQQSGRLKAEVTDRALIWQERLLEQGHGRLFEGVPELLDRLSVSGRTVAYHSSGSRRYVEMVVRRLRLDRHTHLWASERPGRSKATICRDYMRRVGTDTAIVVGDRASDVEAAHDAGALAIGCVYGFGAPDELDDADLLVRSVSDLASALGIDGV